ncbi:MAG: hypothetical protein Ct9H300mP16_09580 [Pseudomonadota bacterium]|nr:MAG: hypothetical protein Ct9H300mP16_09580 [Pseudomonadota bacterium]
MSQVSPLDSFTLISEPSGAINEGKGTYHSRSRNALWIKGETSGAVQKLHRVELDCDRDPLRFTVASPAPGFCHLENSHAGERQPG